MTTRSNKDAASIAKPCIPYICGRLREIEIEIEKVRANRSLDFPDRIAALIAGNDVRRAIRELETIEGFA